MMSYSKQFKLKCIKHVELGISSIPVVAELKKVPPKTLYRWIKFYYKFGENSLENKKPGALPLGINEKFEQLILDKWKDRKRSCHKLWIDMKMKGYNVSERQIQKIYKKHGFVMNKRKRPSQIKFVKYEWPKPNMLWHTDWTQCPFTGAYLIAFIDDHSRFIVHAEYFANASTENTLIAFTLAIKKYGKPDAILTDNGVQFHVNGLFEEFCKSKEIHHILGRVHHPQTNGKIERWFGTYKQEFKEGEDTLDSFVKYYNEERLHQGINYATPIQRYKIDINAV
ncbi:MAG: DDE-type integrase/transposase/recombinase [Bacteroidales bacterium]|nr:DDE-type integrase/transposase/recombinase [Bacteroidales bacterium]